MCATSELYSQRPGNALPLPSLLPAGWNVACSEPARLHTMCCGKCWAHHPDHRRITGLIAPDAGRWPSAISCLWNYPQLKTCLAWSHIPSGPCGDTKVQHLTLAWDIPEGPSQPWSSSWGWLRPVEAASQQYPQEPSCMPTCGPTCSTRRRG